MRVGRKYIVFNILALITCIVPPIATTLYYFPLWFEKGTETAISGVSALLLLICLIPMIRHIKQFFRNPSAKLIWFIGLALFWMLESIAHEMIIICAVGFISNCAGSILYKIRDRYRRPRHE